MRTATTENYSYPDSVVHKWKIERDALLDLVKEVAKNNLSLDEIRANTLKAKALLKVIEE